METALTVVGSVAVAFITAWITTVVKLRREHELDIDKELRDARINAYKKPWSDLKDLSKHRSEAPSFEELNRLVATLTDWYYTEGGLYLTQYSQPAFVACVEGIRDVSRTKRGAGTNERISEGTRDLLYDLGSAFRTQMTLDLGSRFESEFKTQHHKDQRSEAAEKSRGAKKQLEESLKPRSVTKTGPDGA
jgi:hypothetical protein